MSHCRICDADLDEHTLEQLQMCELKGKLKKPILGKSKKS